MSQHENVQPIVQTRSYMEHLDPDIKYVPLAAILDWGQTCPRNKRITDQCTKFEKDLSLASEINKRVAVRKKQLSRIECDVLLAHGKYDNPGRTDLKGGTSFNPPCIFKQIGNFLETEGMGLPAKFVCYSADGVVDANRITEFLDQSVQSEYRYLTVEWPFFEGAGQDQQSLDSTLIMSAVKTWLEDHYRDVDKIIFCAEQDANFDNLMNLMPTHFPVYDLEPDPLLEVVEAGFNRVVEAIRDLTNKTCDAIAGRNAEQTEQLDSRRMTKRQDEPDEPDETSPKKRKHVK